MRKATPFGKYTLLDRLNVGGMAEVFIAKTSALEGIERYVAIKKILPTMAEDDEFIRMFIDEARISVQLNHANVVHIHELGKVEDSYFIAMEYVAGKDVRTLLERYRRRKEKMPIPQAVFIACKMCEGLDYAHRKKDARGQELGIIHRDVSPQNILVSYEGEVKIIDFGIAKAANRSQKTQAGILKGKFGYMSPEQVRGQPIDRRSDIFALGVILYELLTGEKLFTGESDYSVLEKVRNAEVPPARDYNPNLPGGLERVLNKALARDPEQRYQWASDLHEDLMRFLVDGDQIYTSKHLSGFMKEVFAEDIKREAQNMERYAGEGVEPAPQPVPTQPPEAAFGEEDGEDSVDKTQLIDSSLVAAYGADEIPPTDATRADAVNPFVPPPAPAAKAKGSSGPKARVVIGQEAAYSGATVVGQMPSRTEMPAVSVPPAEATRLLDTSRKPSGTFELKPAPAAPVNEATRLLDLSKRPSGSIPVQPPAAESREDVTDSQLDIPTTALQLDGPESDTDAQRRLAAAEDSTDALRRVAPEDSTDALRRVAPEDATDTARRMDRLAEEGTDAERRVSGLDEDSTDAQRRHAGEAPAAGDEEPEAVPTDSGEAPPEVQPGTRPIERLKLFAQQNRWAVPAAAGSLVLILLVSVLALIGHKPKGSAVMFKVTRPANAEVRLDGRQVPAGVVVMVPPGMHEAVFSAPGYATQTKELVVAKNRPPMAVEVALTPAPKGGTGQPSGKGPEASPGSSAATQPGSHPTGTPGATAANTKGPSNSTASASGSPDSTGAAHPGGSGPANPTAPNAVASGAAEKTPGSATAQTSPKHFTARFEADASGIEIAVDGKVVGKTPKAQLANLVIGTTYHFTARRSGYHDYSGTFGSKGEEAVVVPVELEKLAPQPSHAEEHHEHASASHHSRRRPNGRLACSSRPAGAEIWVDNHSTGRQTPVALSNPLMLPVGPHTVVFRMGRKRSEPLKVVIDQKETTKLVNVPLQ